MKMTGTKIAAIAMVVAIAAKVISLRTVECRLPSIFAHLEMSHDVLEHHDRIVDDNPDRETQAQQCKGVERETKEVQGNEGAQRSKWESPARR